MSFTLNDTDIKVQEYLNTLGIKYEVYYLGSNSEKWPHDKFNTVFTPRAKSSYSFEFSTGLGHRVLLPNGTIPKLSTFHGTKHKELTGWTKAFIANGSFRPTYVVVKPTAANVLSSILRDGTAVDTSFHDWASDYGYNTDSISARNVYDECCTIGVKLRSLFTFAERTALTELLQDY